MRCLACNCALTDRESVRKYAESEEFLDLCNSCLNDCEGIEVDDSFVEDEFEQEYEDEE